MSVHKCPNCKEFAFHWKNDEEISPMTIWNCHSCNYDAFEDEKLERPCPDCEYKYGIQLQELSGSIYWWCSSCERKIVAS